MKRLILSLAIILFAINSFAQTPVGDWNGALDINGTSLHLVFHIQKTGDTYKTTFDSPDQGAKGINTDKTTVTGNQIIIEAAELGIKYTAAIETDGSKISGTFAQGPASLPLVLTKTTAPAK